MLRDVLEVFRDWRRVERVARGKERVVVGTRGQRGGMEHGVQAG